MGSKERFYVDIMSLHPEVTGSCNLVVVKYPDGTSTNFIVDCGLFQEKEYSEYNKDFPFDSENISFCILTHNHVDHTGRLPLLVKKGFNGKIYTSEANLFFAPLALEDSCKVLRGLAKRNHASELYSDSNVTDALKLFKCLNFEETERIDENIRITLFKNGHLLGAAMALVQISYPECCDINLLFTGDYHYKNMFFDVPDLPDWVLELPITIIQESTYGNMESNQISECFEENVLRCMNKKGTAVCMVFSLGRAQEILYIIKRMQETGKLDIKIPIYFDGKLAHRYTKLYLDKELGIREEMKNFLPENLSYVDKSCRDSVIFSKEQKIIVTTSGMGTYGPSQRYIPAYISENNVLLQFTGYTTEGTMGARLKNAEEGEIVNVGSLVCKKRAEVEYTTEFSAHAKADDMIKFLQSFRYLKLVLVNHGETKTKEVFARRIVEDVDAKNVAVLNRDYFFRICPYGLIRQISTKFN